MNASNKVKPNKIIIHELIKEQGTTSADLFLTDELIPIDSRIKELVQKLHESYASDKLVYAIFKNDSTEQFPKSFRNYVVVENESAKSFINYSKETIKRMREQIRGVAPAKGGFYVFVEYVFNDQTYYGIFLVRDVNGILFNKNTNKNKVEVQSVVYMNTDKLAMACRITKAKYLINDGKYLTFLRRNKETVSEYFMNWIAASQPESSKEFTETLYYMVNNIQRPIDPITQVEYDLDEFRKKVSSIVKDRNRTVDLKELGKIFYDDENIFTQFREDNQLEIDTEFRADGRALRKFTQIDIKANGIHLKFSRGDLTERIIEPGNDDSIIIHSSELRSKLAIELNDEGLN